MEVQEISLDKAIETKLIQGNVTDAILAELKEKYGSMKLASLDDKESYLELKDAAKVCAKVRSLTVSICKKGRERAVAEQKKWVAKEKEIVAEIATVEDPLDAEIKQFDDEVDRKIAEEKKRKENEFINRQATLTKMGAQYIDGSFVLGEASFEMELVKGASQDVWDEAVIPKFEAEFAKIEAVKIEEKRREKEYADAMKKQQEELAQKQHEFQEQQATFARQQEENARIERDKAEAEQREKVKAKTELQNSRLQKIIPFNPYSKDVPINVLWSLTESDFDTLYSNLKSLHEKEQYEKQAQIEAQAAQRERERIEAEQRQAEEKRQQEDARKAEELAKASDKVKYAALIQKIQAISVPDMRSGQYRNKVSIIREKLEEILSL